MGEAAKTLYLSRRNDTGRSGSYCKERGAKVRLTKDSEKRTAKSQKVIEQWVRNVHGVSNIDFLGTHEPYVEFQQRPGQVVNP